MPINSADLAALLNDKVINDAFEIARSSRTGILSTVAMRAYRDWETDRKSTRLNSSHRSLSRMPSSA